MKRLLALPAALALLGLSVTAQADVFNMGPGFTNLETVVVGDPGNTGELSGAGAGGYGPDRICGSVGYAYRIGKYEVTTKQYTDFLNAKATTDPYGLYNANMSDTSFLTGGCNIQREGVGTPENPYTYSVAADWANRPVNYVSYYSSLRFVNWLNNGQGYGDTETGAYTMSGDAKQRNPGAEWFLPNEDEWYKAAYYKGGGTNAGYWSYPTQSNIVPDYQVINPDPGNNANYNNSDYHAMLDVPWRTHAGEFENSEGIYGTFDQAGNVWEWVESDLQQGGAFQHGGCYGNATPSYLAASYRYTSVGFGPDDSRGFRVAAVPEPSSVLILASGLIGLLGVRRRRA